MAVAENKKIGKWNMGLGWVPCAHTRNPTCHNDSDYFHVLQNQTPLPFVLFFLNSGQRKAGKIKSGGWEGS